MGGDAVREDDAAFAVAAHGLLNSLSIVKGTTDMLRGSFPDLPPEQVRFWLDRIDNQAGLMASILHDLVRGLPREAIIELDALVPEGVRAARRQ